MDNFVQPLAYFFYFVLMLLQCKMKTGAWNMEQKQHYWTLLIIIGMYAFTLQSLF